MTGGLEAGEEVGAADWAGCEGGGWGGGEPDGDWEGGGG